MEESNNLQEKSFGFVFSAAAVAVLTHDAERAADRDDRDGVDLADECASVGLLHLADAQVVGGPGVVGHAEPMVLQLVG